MKIGLISLGCAKNRVDSEMVLGLLKKAHFTVVNDYNKADAIIINTCGFIESAKKESIETIFEMADTKKDLIVMGCLAERYYDNLKKEMPEVSLFIRIKDYPKIGEILTEHFSKKINGCLSFHERLLSTPSYMAYVRIADGCNNRCNYCAIPLIRGDYQSRTEDDVYEEVFALAQKGIKEINLIAQDTTAYGVDLGNTNLVSLLKRIEKIEGLVVIRVLYLYPSDVSDELIQVIKESTVIAPYFDIPIQHITDKMLAKMNRRGSQENTIELIKRIRGAIPHAVLRTTLIIGFPYEEEEDQMALKAFIKEARFDRLGAFLYSKEEDTKGFDMPQVNKNTAKRRYNEIMRMQEVISLEKGQERIGEIHKTIICDFEGYYYIGRSYAFAPDDIDGYIFVESDDKLAIGEVVDCRIFEADSYNLFGKKL